MSGDRYDSSTWILEWMTEDRHVKSSATDFLNFLNFPRFESNGFETRVHRVDEISDEESHILMDPEKVGDYLSYGSPRPECLTFNNQTFYHILCYTICPLAGTNDSGSIHGVLHNTLYALSGGYVFDIEDLFIRILVDSAEEPRAAKVFAPWIQKIIDQCMKKEYLAKENHKGFIPPVRDTLQVMEDLSKGKAIAASPRKSIKQFDGPKIPHKKKCVKPPVPTQLEISLCSHQLLLKHMEDDRKKKEHLVNELI